jgi:hypothetical protein
LQGPALHSVTIEAAHDPIIDEYLAKVSVNDAEIAAEFGETAATEKIRARFLNVDIADFRPPAALVGTIKRTGGLSYIDASALVRRVQRDSIIARASYTISTDFRHIHHLVGDIVGYTDSRVPNGKGGTASGNHLVVGKTISTDGDGRVLLTLLALRKGWSLAPAAMISAYNAGTKTATLNGLFSGANPGLLFPAGCDVYVHNCNTGTTEFLSVQSSTATTVTFVGAMTGFTTANLSLMWFDDGVSSTGRSAADYATQLGPNLSAYTPFNSTWG